MAVFYLRSGKTLGCVMSRIGCPGLFFLYFSRSFVWNFMDESEYYRDWKGESEKPYGYFANGEPYFTKPGNPDYDGDMKEKIEKRNWDYMLWVPKAWTWTGEYWEPMPKSFKFLELASLNPYWAASKEKTYPEKVCLFGLMSRPQAWFLFDGPLGKMSIRPSDKVRFIPFSLKKVYRTDMSLVVIQGSFITKDGFEGYFFSEPRISGNSRFFVDGVMMGSSECSRSDMLFYGGGSGLKFDCYVGALDYSFGPFYGMFGPNVDVYTCDFELRTNSTKSAAKWGKGMKGPNLCSRFSHRITKDIPTKDKYINFKYRSNPKPSKYCVPLFLYFICSFDFKGNSILTMWVHSGPLVQGYCKSIYWSDSECGMHAWCLLGSKVNVKLRLPPNVEGSMYRGTSGSDSIIDKVRPREGWGPYYDD